MGFWVLGFGFWVLKSHLKKGEHQVGFPGDGPVPSMRSKLELHGDRKRSGILMVHGLEFEVSDLRFKV